MALTNVNLIEVFRHAKGLLSAGSALKKSGSLINTEATAAALYGIVSAGVQLAQALGYDVQVSWVDMHTMTNGWAITASTGYAIYRVITNEAAGFRSKPAE